MSRTGHLVDVRAHSTHNEYNSLGVFRNLTCLLCIKTKFMTFAILSSEATATTTSYEHLFASFFCSMLYLYLPVLLQFRQVCSRFIYVHSFIQIPWFCETILGPKKMATVSFRCDYFVLCFEGFYHAIASHLFPSRVDSNIPKIPLAKKHYFRSPFGLSLHSKTTIRVHSMG